MAEITYRELCQKIYNVVTSESVGKNEKELREYLKNKINHSRELRENETQKNIDCGSYYDHIHPYKFGSLNPNNYIGIYYNDILFSRIETFYTHKHTPIPIFLGLERYGNLPASKGVELVRKDMDKPYKDLWTMNYKELCKTLEDMLKNIILPEVTYDRFDNPSINNGFDYELKSSGFRRNLVNVYTACLQGSFEDIITFEMFPNIRVDKEKFAERDKDGYLPFATLHYTLDDLTAKSIENYHTGKFATIKEKDGKLSVDFRNRDWMKDTDVRTVFTLMYNDDIMEKVKHLELLKEEKIKEMDNEILKTKSLLLDLPEEKDELNLEEQVEYDM